VDGDGHDSNACGGGDCDDRDPLRFPGNPEICDLMNHDEDCDPTSFGTDIDGDGEEPATCCNGASCGTDCNDTDPGIGSMADEVCNGIDDDCDSTIDEGFDCVQSQTVAGTNACGREGMRRCSETCTWLDVGFIRPESGTSCDYCDDSGAGLGEELAFTASRTETFSHTGRSVGSVRCNSFGCMPPLGGRVLLNADTSNDVGGRFTSTPFQIGYGVVSVEVRVNARAGSANPGTGWAIVLLDADGGGSSMLGTGANSGVPLDREGFALEHRYADGDTVSLLQMTGGAASALHERSTPDSLSGPTGTTAAQWMRQEITPDDPSTPTDETALWGFHPAAVCVASSFPVCPSCSNEGARPCGATIRPGDRFEVGVVAGSTTNRSEVEITEATVTGAAQCPLP